ncbi:hypothetical protein EWM64_g2710 [Hericium alpestre]|uniref:Uncharacterized protein n=1 Tax=Hericium alpestre TaxID=135208 RepID=A0A4Z0A4W4_9AGAM|nr:hypothetical protein EWM64_g2710 [Hericium alpestre]
MQHSPSALQTCISFTMHPVLNNDIITQVIEELWPKEDASLGLKHHFFSEDPSGGRAAVLALVRSSKRFLEPGLDALWRNLPSVFPLLYVLRRGEDSVGSSSEDSELEDIINYMVPTRKHSSSNWARFNYYASRVRGLQVSGGGAIVTDFLLALSANTDRTPISLDVERLMWDHNPGHIFPYITLFYGPALKRLTVTPVSLEIPLREQLMARRRRRLDQIAEQVLMSPKLSDDWPYYRGWVYGVFSALMATCPNFQEFSIQGANGPVAKQSAVHHRAEALTMILAIKSVPALSCAYRLSSAAVDHIAAMPGLRSLVLFIDLPIPLSPDMPFFSALDNLTLCHVSARATLAFLDHLGGRRPFKSLNIAFDDCACACVVNRLMASVNNSCARDTLERLCIQFCPSVRGRAVHGQDNSGHGDGSHEDNDHEDIGDSETDVVDGMLISASLQFLLEFAKMRVFSFISCAICWDDDFIASAAPAWPCLELLHLGCGPYEDDLSRVTLPGLLPLARNCPRLERLKLELDAWFKDDARAWQEKDWVHRAPWPLPSLEMQLGDAPDMAERRVARWLKTYFPNVHSVSDASVQFWLCCNLPENQDLTEEEYLERHEREEDSDDEYLIKFPSTDGSSRYSVSSHPSSRLHFVC